MCMLWQMIAVIAYFWAYGGMRRHKNNNRFVAPAIHTHMVVEYDIGLLFRVIKEKWVLWLPFFWQTDDDKQEFRPCFCVGMSYSKKRTRTRRPLFLVFNNRFSKLNQLRHTMSKQMGASVYVKDCCLPSLFGNLSKKKSRSRSKLQRLPLPRRLSLPFLSLLPT